jgi:hypothetical protein
MRFAINNGREMSSLEIWENRPRTVSFLHMTQRKVGGRGAVIVALLMTSRCIRRAKFKLLWSASTRVVPSDARGPKLPQICRPPS